MECAEVEIASLHQGAGDELGRYRAKKSPPRHD
jgi:hypothetical protein